MLRVWLKGLHSIKTTCRNGQRGCNRLGFTSGSEMGPILFGPDGKQVIKDRQARAQR